MMITFLVKSKSVFSSRIFYKKRKCFIVALASMIAMNNSTNDFSELNSKCGSREVAQQSEALGVLLRP